MVQLIAALVRRVQKPLIRWEIANHGNGVGSESVSCRIRPLLMSIENTFGTPV